MRFAPLTCMCLFSCAAAALAATPKLDPPVELGPRRAGPPVGFVTHPLMPPLAGNLKALADTPATAELTNLFCWTMTRDFSASDTVTLEDQQVDLSRGDAWLREVSRSGRGGYPILDTSITHSEIAWRQAITRRAGQSVVDYMGDVRTWSSLHSPLFRESVYNYIDQIIDWVKVNDADKRIPGYFNGAEWFYHYCTFDYNPLALAAFRKWLKTRYATLPALNEAWGSTYADWEGVMPPQNVPIGDGISNRSSYSLGGPLLATWASPVYAVTPGQDLTAEVEISSEGVNDGFVGLSFNWFNDQGKELSNAYYPLETEQRGQGKLVASLQVPMPLNDVPTVIARTELRLRLNGPGKASFRNPVIRDAVSGQPLTPLNAGDVWKNYNTGPTKGSKHDEQGTTVFELEAATPALPYAHAGVALEDWTVFSFEAMALWLDETARHIKQRDPERQVASYVGWGLAMLSQWEGANQVQRVDISFANTPSLEVNGFQMCIAGDDFCMATFLTDIARKYGKPMWATDLVDFPYGLFSGFGPIYRGSLANVQHGLDGFFYYNWWGTADYSFSDHLSKGEIETLLENDKAAIEACKDFELRTDVAVLSPILSFSLADEGGTKGDPIDAGGLYRLVLDMGHVPDVWTPYEIGKQGAAALSRYKVIFVSDCPVLPTDVHQALRSYVEQGGVIIGTGRSPVRDLAGRPLASPLLPDGTASDAQHVTLGKGQVIWNSEPLGSKYWGKVRRVAVYGNTPAMNVEMPDPNRTPLARRQARERLIGQAAKAGFTPEVAVDARTGAVHVSTFSRPDGERLLFLVHTGPGRIYSAPLTINIAGIDPQVKVQGDFGKEQTATIEPDGKLMIPSFTHCSLVRLAPKR